MKKICMDCGSSLIGRSDKKFCSDLCRNNYHNRRNQVTNNYVRRVNYALRRNRRILEKFNENGHEQVKRNLLVSEGFDFEYMTSQIQKENDVPLCFCYEQGYRVRDNGFVELIRKKE